MNDVNWQRKSAVTLLKQQLHESKQLQEFLELEKSQLKRVIQQMENDWQHDRSRLEKDKRKLEKAQEFYAKLCNSKLALKKKLAEKEELRQKMKCDLQQMNYKVMSLSNEIQIEKAHVADLEAVSEQGNCLDVDCEMQLLSEVSGQLEQASDELLLAKERVKRSSQELRYLMCQLTESDTNVSPVSSGDEPRKQGQKKEHIDHICMHFDSPTDNKASAGNATWTLCQPIIGTNETLLNRHKCHQCSMPCGVPEKLPCVGESEAQTKLICGQTFPIPCNKALKQEDFEGLLKATNTGPYRKILPNFKHYVLQTDQATSCDIQSVCSEMLHTPQCDVTPAIQDLKDMARKVKPAAAQLELSSCAELVSPEIQQSLPDQSPLPCDSIKKVEPQPRMLVAVCDTSLQCSSEPISERGGGTCSASSSDIPYTSLTSTSPRTPNFVLVTHTENENRNKPSPIDDDCEPVMRTPPLRQPIQLTICQQFYQPLRPICPPATFARTSAALPRETLFFREPMPHLTLAESPEQTDACVGTSPTHSPVDDIKLAIENKLNTITQQLTAATVTENPLIYQADLACSSDSSRSQSKTTLCRSNNSTSVSPIRAQEYPLLTPQYHTQLEISNSSSSGSDLESIEIVEIGPETLPVVQCKSENFILPEDHISFAYISDVDAE